MNNLQSESDATFQGCRWIVDRDQSDICRRTQTVRRCPAPWQYAPTSNDHTHRQTKNLYTCYRNFTSVI